MAHGSAGGYCIAHEIGGAIESQMPLKKIAKALKRPEGGILQKAAKLKLTLKKG
jgi:hypothetical protein